MPGSSCVPTSSRAPPFVSRCGGILARPCLVFIAACARTHLLHVPATLLAARLHCPRARMLRAAKPERHPAGAGLRHKEPGPPLFSQFRVVCVLARCRQSVDCTRLCGVCACADARWRVLLSREGSLVFMQGVDIIHAAECHLRSRNVAQQAFDSQRYALLCA